jgi:hypothetical protein
MLAKGTKHDFAYQEGPSTPPRCNKCQYFIKSGACQLVRGKISGQNGSCNYWVEGESKNHYEITPPFSKIQSGYVEYKNGPRCGVCRFYGSPRQCQLVKGDIDPTTGCCSAWKK